jgi:hypothetical protein
MGNPLALVAVVRLLVGSATSRQPRGNQPLAKITSTRPTRLCLRRSRYNIPLMLDRRRQPRLPCLDHAGLAGKFVPVPRAGSVSSRNL